MHETRVLSGMRPTGSLHLGHYHGVLKNWVRLQAEYLCLYFVADWHALTTDYEKPDKVKENGWDMVVDWLAAGIDPNQAILFIQSQVPDHAELHLLLASIIASVADAQLADGRYLGRLFAPLGDLIETLVRAIVNL